MQAKFIGAPIVVSKKKANLVPKRLVTNLGGPRHVWVLKKELISLQSHMNIIDQMFIIDDDDSSLPN